MPQPRAIRVSNFLWMEERFKLTPQGAAAAVKDLLSEAIVHEMEDPQGQRWTISGMVAQAWLHQNASKNDWAQAIRQAAKIDPDWGEATSLAWALAATYQPCGDPKDPVSEVFEQWHGVLANAWGELSPDQRLKVGAQAMELLTRQWGRLSQHPNPEKYRNAWLLHALEWSVESKGILLDDHPDWPGWVGDRLTELIATGAPKGIRAYEIEALLSLDETAQDASENRIRTWARLGRDLFELYAHFQNLGQQGADHIPGFWMGAAAAYFNLASHWADIKEVDLGSDHHRIETRAFDIVSTWKPGQVPFTERQRLGAAFQQLQARWGARMAHHRMDRALPTSTSGASRAPRL